MQEIEHFFAPFYLTKNNIFLFAFEKMELRFIATLRSHVTVVRNPLKGVDIAEIMLLSQRKRQPC